MLLGSILDLVGVLSPCGSYLYPGRQWMMTQVCGALLPMGETRMEALAPDLRPAQRQLLRASEKDVCLFLFLSR